ncbi:hypothetical protein LCGC14_0561810 [marine sediment metagenome]|uniref:Uncharacterized protein n=1 Tax=marine sediment metagenome TaxID=412755 RepID=A0A0F9RRZ8_9ZZZZ
MTRRIIREALVTIFTAEGSFNQVLGYAPVSVDGMDKVLSIFSDKTHHKQESLHLEHNFYSFSLDVLVKRSGGETAEDTLDDLHEVVRDVIGDNQGNAIWEYLSLEDPSDAYFAEISGVAYRVEKHLLFIKENA